MKTLLRILICLFFSHTMLNAQETTTFNGQNITVKITNVDSNEGQLLIALYDSESSFLKSTYKSFKSEIKNKSCTVTFKDVPKGVYAISLFHDENNNNKLDANFLGIPEEAYGCSNNATGFMGPPKWQDAKFEITDKDIKQTIKL